MGGSRNARLLRRVLFASVVAGSGLVVAAPMAAADPCPPLDLGCVVDTGGVPEDPTTTAGGVLEDTTTTVGGVLQDTTTTVGDVLQGGGGGGPIDPGPILDGIVPGSGGVPSGGGGSTPGGEGSTPGGGGGGGNPGGGTQVVPPSSSQSGPSGVRFGSRGLILPTGDASPIAGRPLPSFLENGSGGAVFGAQLVRTLAFPFVLILLVIGFVIAQNRIDRKDPKLALAPVGSEYLTFP